MQTKCFLWAGRVDVQSSNFVLVVAHLIIQLASRSHVCMILTLKALPLHIDSIVENITIEETLEAIQEPEGEPQFQEEPEADQDANLNLTNSATNQGKPRCISTIIIASLLYHYLCIISVHVL